MESQPKNDTATVLLLARKLAVEMDSFLVMLEDGTFPQEGKGNATPEMKRAALRACLGALGD